MLSLPEIDLFAVGLFVLLYLQRIALFRLNCFEFVYNASSRNKQGEQLFEFCGASATVDFLFHDNSQINRLLVCFRQNRSCPKQRIYMKQLIRNYTVNCQPYTAGA